MDAVANGRNCVSLGAGNFCAAHTTASAGTAGTLSVNDFTGNAVLSHTDAATSGLLMPISVTHVYNGYMAGQDFTAPTKFTDKIKPFAGYGWKLNLYQMVRSSSVYGLSGDYQTKWPYVYTDGDGTEHYFMKTSDGKYKDEDGLGLELKTISGGYTIGDDKGGLMTFDSKGNLTRIQDANGNTASLTYSNGFITQITDGAGHVIKLENNGTNLTKVTDPSGKATTYTYSGGLLTRITYPDGTHSDYAYDGLDRRFARGFCRLFDGLAAAVYRFDRLLRSIGRAAHPSHGVLRLLFRQVGFSSLKIVLCLGDILLGVFYTLAAELIQPVGNFVRRRFRPGQSAVGGVFFGRGFRRKNAVLRLVLGADIGVLHPLGGHRRLVNHLYRSLDRISRLDVGHGFTSAHCRTHPHRGASSSSGKARYLWGNG